MKKLLVALFLLCAALFALASCGEEAPEEAHKHNLHSEEVLCEKKTVEYFCEVCQKDVTEVIAGRGGHDFSPEFTVDTEAGENEDGVKSRHCLNCDAVTDVTVIGKTGGYTYVLQSEYTDTEIPDEDDTYVITKYNGSKTVLTIPEEYMGKPVTYIAEYAFEGVKGVSEVTIPDSINGVNDYAFRGCEGLVKVVISDSVKELGRGVFEGCSSLTSVNIPNGVVELCDTFKNCSSLKELTVPESVKNMTSTFEGCASLTSFVIPESVEYMAYTFGGCTALEEITIPFVGSDRQDAESNINVIFDYEVPASLKKITLTGGERLGRYAFYYLENIKEVVLPDSITEIDPMAFGGCKSLEKLTVPAVSGITLGHLESLKEVVINGGEKIGERFFAECLMLERVTLADSIVKIEEKAFSGCRSLTKITVPEAVTEIGARAFWNCSALEELKLPEGLLTIGMYAFENCFALRKINFPKSLTLIGEYAFSVTALEEVNIPSGEIRENAFYNCEKIKAVTVGEGVAKIGESAFSECENLEVLTLSEGIQEIGKNAFFDCESLTELVIPESVKQIGRHAFYDCTGLVKVTLPFLGDKREEDHPTLTTFADIFTGVSSVKEIVLLEQRYIYDNAFECLGNLEKITLPENLEFIGKSAFSYTGLKSIELPEGLVRIGDEAFVGCGFVELVIPDSVRYLGKDMLLSCSALEKLQTPFIGRDDSIHSENVEAYKLDYFFGVVPYVGGYALKSVTVTGGYYRNDIYEDTYYYLHDSAFRYWAQLEEIILPDNLRVIGTSAFEGCTGLRKIEIPNTVRSIIDSAFAGCTGLESIKLPSGVFAENEIKQVYIGFGAFSGCTSLKEVSFSTETPTEIGEIAFVNCTSLTKIVIPKNVVKIGFGAFRGCSALEEITVPFTGKVSPLENYASESRLFGWIFADRWSENELDYQSDLPESLKTVYYTPVDKNIYKNAFKYCSIEEIYIDEGVENIGEYAFYCSSLKHVELPDSLKNIYDSAFADCYILNTIVAGGQIEEIRSTAFDNSPEISDLYFRGNEEEWAGELKNYVNQYLPEVTVHYSYGADK